METHAKYTLVGGFVITFIVAIIIFVLLISRYDFGSKGSTYNIFFEGAVTGLRVNEDVRFHGIPIGKIKKISVDLHNINRVKVQVRIQETKLMREDVYASIEMQGLTGYSYVQIQGGSPESPNIHKKENEEYPVIPSQRSRIDLLFNNVPALVSNVHDLLNQFKLILSEDNRTHFNQILKNGSIISHELSQGEHSIKNTLKEAKSTLSRIHQSTLQLTEDLHKTIEHFGDTVNSLHTILKSNQENFGTTMSQLPKTLKEIQNVAENVNKITQQVDQRPLDFINKSADLEYTFS